MSADGVDLSIDNVRDFGSRYLSRRRLGRVAGVTSLTEYGERLCQSGIEANSCRLVFFNRDLYHPDRFWIGMESFSSPLSILARMFSAGFL